MEISLQRLKVDYFDIMLCHDIEFVEMARVVEETIPALRAIQKQGKVRFIGVSGYPMNLFRYVLDRTDLDVILSYNHYTLQNTMLAEMVPYLNEKGVGIMNAAPFSARLLTNSTLPPWHKATPEVRATCRRAAEHCEARGVDIAQLAVQYSVANPDMATCIVGSANPENVRKWVEWADKPMDRHSSARCSKSCGRSTTGSTSKAARRITTLSPPRKRRPRFSTTGSATGSSESSMRERPR